MNCCDYKCNQGRDCPAREKPVGQPPIQYADEEPDDGNVGDTVAAAIACACLVAALVFVGFMIGRA